MFETDGIWQREVKLCADRQASSGLVGWSVGQPAGQLSLGGVGGEQTNDLGGGDGRNARRRKRPPRETITIRREYKSFRSAHKYMHVALARLPASRLV